MSSPEIPEDERFIVLDHKRGKLSYLYKNFLYHKASGDSPKIIYRCAQYQSVYNCQVKLWKTPDGKVTVVGGEHNHEDAKNAEAISAMKKEMTEKACATHDFPNDIFRNVGRNHPIAREHISTPAYDSFIKRKRKELERPKVPASLEVLGTILETNEEMKKIVQGNYRGIIHPPQGKLGCALLFVKDNMLKELNEAKVLEIDGTMKAVPEAPEGTQMWVITIRKHNKGFAAAFAYCRGAKAVLYEAILRRLLELAPGLIHVKFILTDFEKAAFEGLSISFSSSKTSRLLVPQYPRHWKLLRLQNAPCEPKYIARSMALLAPHIIQIGVEIVKDISARYIHLFPKLDEWSNYIQHEWGDKPDVVSVYGSSIRTNNDSEAFNRHYTSRAGGRKPHVFQFIRNLQEIIEDEVVNVKRSNANIPIVKAQRTQEIYEKDTAILNAQKNLLSKTITKEAVYNFMKDNLPANLSKEIDEERLKVAQGNVTKKTFMRKSKISRESSSHDDGEYGVKRKRSRKTRTKKIVTTNKSS